MLPRDCAGPRPSPPQGRRGRPVEQRRLRRVSAHLRSPLPCGWCRRRVPTEDGPSTSVPDHEARSVPSLSGPTRPLSQLSRLNSTLEQLLRKLRMPPRVGVGSPPSSRPFRKRVQTREGASGAARSPEGVDATSSPGPRTPRAGETRLSGQPVRRAPRMNPPQGSTLLAQPASSAD